MTADAPRPSGKRSLFRAFLLTAAFAAAPVAVAAVTEGGPFPVDKPIPLSDLDGKAVDLSSRFPPNAGPQTRAVLVVFWATWCKPCIHEIPVIRELNRYYGPAGLRVVAIGVNQGDETRQRLAEATARHGIDYPVLFDWEGHAARMFGVFALPSAALIDSAGIVRWLGPALPPDINGRIESALGPGEERGSE